MLKLFALSFLISTSAAAEDPVFELDPIEVWNEEYGQSFRQVHPVNRVSKEQILSSGTNDVTRLVKQQTGVQVQEEDAWGLRPNIGIRGTPPHRSRKISIYEDGLLIGPAPYSAPAAYYTPNMSRIENLEIFKGLAAVMYGPNTIGGSLDYVTRRFAPQRHLSQMNLQYGAFNTQKINLYSSHQINSLHQLLFSGELFTSQGFKQIDYSSKSTGFEKSDLLIKYAYQLPNHPSQIRAKIGYAAEASNETYLGLTQQDFESSPYRRYLASDADQMTYLHQQYSLGWFWFPSSGAEHSIQLYRHLFNRNWKRLNAFSGNSLPSIQTVLKSQDSLQNQSLLDLLRGDLNSSDYLNTRLVRAGNNRFFVSEGLQYQGLIPIAAGSLNQKVKVMARAHQDQISRRHTEDEFTVEDRRLIMASEGALGTQNDDSSRAQMVATEYEITLGALTAIANLRFEQVAYSSYDLSTLATTSRSDQSLTPGLGGLLAISSDWALFSSVNQAVTLVGPQGAQDELPEKALNFEVGTRFYQSDSAVYFEGLYFRSDYQNIKGVCSFSSGCTGPLDSTFSGGAALIQGLEIKAHSTLSKFHYRFPIEANITLMQAQFVAPFESTNPDWGVGQIFAGDPIPYVPNVTASLSAGVETGSWGSKLVIQNIGEQADQAVATGRLSVPTHTIFDFHGHYLSGQHRISLRLDNLAGTQYLVSYKPFGARPGKPQSAMIGYQYTF